MTVGELNVVIFILTLSVVIAFVGAACGVLCALLYKISFRSAIRAKFKDDPEKAKQARDWYGV